MEVHREKGENYGGGTTPCDGQPGWEEDLLCPPDSPVEWPTWEFTLCMDGFMSGNNVRLPGDWFTYIDDKELHEYNDLVAQGAVLLTGKRASVFWINPNIKHNKHYVVTNINPLVNVVLETEPGTEVFFVSSVPVVGSNRMNHLNFYKNVSFAVRKMCKKNVRVSFVGIHHWCLRQGKVWETVEDITGSEKNMLLFLIVDEVLSKLGLASSHVL